MAITCFADEIREDFRNDSETFELACRDYVRQNREKDDAFFALAFRVGLDKPKASDRFREVARAMGLLAIAGSREIQRKTEEEAKKAADVLAANGKKFLEVAAKAQADYDALEKTARLAAQRVEHQRGADKQLPELAPKVVKKEVSDAESLLNTQGVGAELRAAKQRHQELTCILNVDGVYPNQADHIQHGLKRLLPEAVVTGVTGRMVEYGYSPMWPSLKAECEREFTELNPRLPELQAAYDKALTIVRKPLADYFYKAAEAD